MKNKVYISGPMRGYPDCNYPAFAVAAKHLRDSGYAVVSPHEFHNGAMDLPFSAYMRADLVAVCGVDEIALLPGWQDSEGVWYELMVAKAAGVAAWEYDTEEDFGFGRYISDPISQMRFSPFKTTEPTPDPETILEEAQRLVYGDRGAAYGHPYEDFSKTAGMWSVLFGVKITPQQVAMAQICVKMSRQMNKPKRDNAVDMAGYAATLQMVVEYEAEYGV